MIDSEPNLDDRLVEPLTRREREILAYLDQGLSAPEIAERLTLAVSSVKWYIQQVYGKLGVNRKLAALSRARALGLLGPVGLAAPTVAAAEAPAPGESPFKGLRHYTEGDAPWFFGREALTAQLLARLGGPPGLGPARFVAVVGASGSGKSSIVRAGLIPALRPLAHVSLGKQPGVEPRFDPVCLLTPTAHPLQALAGALAATGPAPGPAALLDDQVLHDYALRLLSGPASHYLLLVVDQFEELFTLCRGEPERQAFINNLLRAVDPLSGCPVTVLITLRADFYPHCAAYAGLREALASQQVYIGPMATDELRQVVERPAQLGGWEFEPGLVDQILRDVRDAPGALPLLSHALLATWQHRRGRTLTLRSYVEAGRVQGAIATTAEALFQSLPPVEQALARGVFLRLTELGEGTQDTGRRVPQAELLPAGAARAMNEVLQVLSDARLITQDDGVVEVAHEALIREWPTLRGWLSEDRDGLRLHRRLTDAAQDWEALDRDPSELYRGPRLAQVLEWAATHSADLNPLEAEYLAAAQALAARTAAEQVNQHQRELAAARALAAAQTERAEAEKRSATQQTQAAGRLSARNRVITIMGALALLAAAAAGVFGVQANRSATVAQAANTQSAQNLDAAQAVSTQLVAQRDAANHELVTMLNEKLGPLPSSSLVSASVAQLLQSNAVPATAYAFHAPNDVAFDAAGNMYVSECFGPQVVKIDPAGLMTLFASSTGGNFFGDKGPARSAGIMCAVGLAFDQAGNLYVADVGANRIRRIDPKGVIYTIAGGGATGQGDFSGDGGPATQAHLWAPTLIAFDPDGNLYIVDSYNDRIRKVDTRGIITTVAGNGTVGFAGDGGPATQAELDLNTGAVWETPGLALDSHGQLYIADSNNHRVRRVDRQGIITTIAGNGAAHVSGDGGLATAAGLSSPNGLTFDHEGNLYIAAGDSLRVYGDSIRKVDMHGLITTIAGAGWADFSGDNGPAIAATFKEPAGLRFDSAGNLYVVDFGNYRVRKIDPHGIITTGAGSGAP